MRTSLVLLVSSLVLTPAVFGQTTARVDKPDVQPGDAWTYENTTFPAEAKRRFTVRVREVTADSILTGTADGGSAFTRDWALRETKRAGEVTFKGEPGRPQMQFPLEVGKRWTGNNRATYPNGVQHWQGEAFVEKMESVTVPAGTFETYVIRYEGYYNTLAGRANVRWVETIWYAPEARRWVKRDWTSTSQTAPMGTFTDRQMEELVSMSRRKSGAAATPEAAIEK